MCETGVQHDSYFDVQPEEVMPSYNAPGPIPREAFASYLSRSLLKGHGEATKQMLWLEWVQAHTGFDYQAVFQDLRQRGIWETLSEDEQTLLLADFDRVKAHARYVLPDKATISKAVHYNPNVWFAMQLDNVSKKYGFNSRWSAWGLWRSGATLESALAEFTNYYGSLGDIADESTFLRCASDYLIWGRVLTEAGLDGLPAEAPA